MCIFRDGAQREKKVANVPCRFFCNPEHFANVIFLWEAMLAERCSMSVSSIQLEAQAILKEFRQAM